MGLIGIMGTGTFHGENIFLMEFFVFVKMKKDYIKMDLIGLGI